VLSLFFFFQAEDGIRDLTVTGVQTCALPICPYYLAVRVEEHHDPTARPFRDAVGLVKRRADAEVREALLDSLARLDYAARPEHYRVPQLRAVLLARALDSFSDPRPISERDLARTLERLRRRAGVPDTARAWADSLAKT